MEERGLQPSLEKSEGCTQKKWEENLLGKGHNHLDKRMYMFNREVNDQSET